MTDSLRRWGITGGVVAAVFAAAWWALTPAALTAEERAYVGTWGFNLGRCVGGDVVLRDDRSARFDYWPFGGSDWEVTDGRMRLTLSPALPWTVGGLVDRLEYRMKFGPSDVVTSEPITGEDAIEFRNDERAFLVLVRDAVAAEAATAGVSPGEETDSAGPS